MNWLTIIGLSAVGGAIVSVVAFYADLSAWQQARRAARLRRVAELPALRKHLDPWPEFLVFLSRIALGVIAGVVFRSQVTTPLAAFAVGASAPALLAQLGNARVVKQENSGVEPSGNGTDPTAVPSIKLVEIETPKLGEGAEG